MQEVADTHTHPHMYTFLLFYRKLNIQWRGERKKSTSIFVILCFIYKHMQTNTPGEREIEGKRTGIGAVSKFLNLNKDMRMVVLLTYETCIFTPVTASSIVVDY